MPATRPNILILMVDQLNGTFFPDGPADWLHAPNLKALAARSVRFTDTYCASPLCAPSRAAFMSGQLPARTGVYDNAAEFASSIPTFAHHLRAAGYFTALSGKMHFVGPDQLHGFEERLTTDIYPADFGWTPDYRKPGERIDWWYHNLGSVTGAGVAETTNQMEYDDEVAFLAIQKLHQLGRVQEEGRPWCLTVSLTHPHDPYVARRAFWDLYENAPQLDPADAEPATDPHSVRLMEACDHARFAITREHVRRARQGYFANISYVDEKIGQILAALAAMRMADDTVIVFASDHGDMLGERDLWFKMSFLEGSARVPLMIAAPERFAGWTPRSVRTPVSLLDVTPTLAQLAGVSLDAVMPWTDGTSLAALAAGGTAHPPVAMEYAAEGTVSPMVAIREGSLKLIRCAADPDMMFDLATDPGERVNLADDPAHGAAHARLSAMIEARWNLAAYDAAVRESQARRWVVYPALRNGSHFPWDFQPLQKASERYMRNHMDLNVLEESKRYPRGE
jgi:choline-sulfatase